MLVHAAAGGVGTATIQVARALGAEVVAAVGSPEKLELCRELGAREAYLYDELPDDLRVDVVVDPVGGELFEAAVARLRAARPARGDRLRGRDAGPSCSRRSSSGATSACKASTSAGSSAMRPTSSPPRRASCSSSGAPAGSSRVVGAEFPLDDVEQAHELVESRRSIGKVVLLP